jgi:hypothetical protein
MGTTRFDRTARKAFFELQGDPPIRADVNVPAQVQDGLSALYAMRASKLSAGARLTFPILDDGALYTVAMQTAAPERVKVPLGELEAWNLKATITDAQGQSVGQNIGVWISNDARRLPLKLQAELPVGNFVLALREAK